MGHLANVKRRARKLNLLIQCGYKCYYCDIKMTFEESTIDHVNPKFRGGSNEIENKVICCSVCNSLKSCQTIYGFGKSLQTKFNTCNDSDLKIRYLKARKKCLQLLSKIENKSKKVKYGKNQN